MNNSLIISLNKLQSNSVFNYRIECGIGMQLNIIDMDGEIICENLPNFSLLEVSICDNKPSLVINGEIIQNVKIKNDSITLSAISRVGAISTIVSENEIEQLTLLFNNISDDVSKVTIENVFEKLYLLEKELKLEEMPREVQASWYMSRNRIMAKVLDEYDLIDSKLSLTKVGMAWFEGATHNLEDILVESSSPINSKNGEFILFQHNDYDLENGKLVNTRTNFIRESLNGENYLVINDKYNGKEPEIHTKNVKYLEHIRRYRKENKQKFYATSNIDNLFKVLENEFCKEFSGAFHVYHTLLDSYNCLMIDVGWYDLLFKNNRTKKIILLASYNKIAMIYAARLNEVKVYEYQYSAVMKNHLAYTSYIKPTKFVRPDVFLSWGKDWKSSFRKKGVKFKVIGIQKYEKYLPKSTDDINENILFIGQRAVSDKISVSILNALEKYPNSKVYLKLHRAEINNKNELYRELYDLDNKNLIIIDSSEISILECIDKCTHVIGSFSTVLYEAAQRNKKVYVIKTGLYYMAQDLYNNNNNCKLIEHDNISLDLDYAKKFKHMKYFEKPNTNILKY